MWIYGGTHRNLLALAMGEQSLALARELDLREQMAFTLTDLGSQCYLWLGRLKECKTVLNEAMELWKELDNLPMLADSQSTLCWVHVFAAEYDQAITVSEDAYQLSQSIGNLWGQSFSRIRIGLAHWERGRPDRAIAAMEESLRLSESSGFVVPNVLARADLATVYGQLGLTERGLKAAHLADASAQEKYPPVRGYTLGTLAHLHSLHGNYAAAQELITQIKANPNWTDSPMYIGPILVAAAYLKLEQGEFEQALAEAEALLELAFPIYVPQSLYLQAQALLGLGQEEVARQHLLKARSEAEAVDAQWNLWQILHALSQVAQDADDAQELRRQAQEVLRPIVEAIPTTELRVLFLSLPHVQAVLS